MSDLQVDFERIYKTFYVPLCRASANIISDHDAAHDLVQEVFVKLYNNREKWPGIANMKAYLYRAVINASINHNKAGRKFTGLSVDNKVSGDDPGMKLLNEEAGRKMQSALDDLPLQCRTILVLSKYEGLKNREIAEFMGLSVKTVENQMGIALKKLRAALSPYFTGGLLVMLGTGILPPF